MEIPERDWAIFERLIIDDASPAGVAEEYTTSVNVIYLAKSRILKKLRDYVKPTRVTDRV